jgi:predicted dehydrogenase
MSLRVGFLGVAHVHAPAFASVFSGREDIEITGIFDLDLARAQAFASNHGLSVSSSAQDLTKNSDAIVICSENVRHADDVEIAAAAGCALLCEKPVAINAMEGGRIQKAVHHHHVNFMTAFPCPFSPGWQSAERRVKAGEIGKVVAINATNRGTYPGDWLVNPALSGGGAMMDHLVHVADLLHRLLGVDPVQVQATETKKLKDGEVEDCAFVTIDYPENLFATVDSSWCRGPEYKTWGDVTMQIVGTDGVIELDLFAQGLDVFSNSSPSLRIAPSGSDMNSLMIDEWISSINEKREPRITLSDGLKACEYAWMAHQSQPAKA